MCYLKIKIEKSKVQSKKTNFLLNSEYDENLFNILKSVRMEIASNLHIPPFIVCTDVSLKEMSTFYPLTVESLLKIHGIGTNKVEQYGEAFLSAISKYVLENNIDVEEHLKKFSNYNSVSQNARQSSSETRTKKQEKPHKEDTKIVSYNLFKEGKSIDEIVALRKLTKNTIENHLLACFEDGLDINLDNYLHIFLFYQIFQYSS